MSRPAISSEKLSDSLTISERHASSEHKQGYWLYDKTQGMNLSMGAATKEAALLEALQYYQKRLATVEADYKELTAKVDSFLVQFSSNDTDR